MSEKFGKMAEHPPAAKPFEEEGMESIQVGTDRIEFIPAGDEAFIEHVRNCIGIVAYQPETREACAGHFPEVQSLKWFLRVVNERFPSLSGLKFFLGGVSSVTRKDSLDQDRALALRILREANVLDDQIQVEFNDQPSHVLDMVFETKTGKVEYRYEEMGSNEEDK